MGGFIGAGRRVRPLRRRRRFPSFREAGIVYTALAVLVGVWAATLDLGGRATDNLPQVIHLPQIIQGVDAQRARVGAQRATFTICRGARSDHCVIDGDTIRYRGRKIRLADIDAPEIFSPKCAEEKVRGERAKMELLRLLNAGDFALVRSGFRDTDRYGRQLRTIERDGRSLADGLVAKGLARPWDGARRGWCG